MAIHEPFYERHRIEYVRPPMYEKQFNALFDPHRYSLIEASTKAGKTSGAIIWFHEKGLQGLAGQNFWWVAPVSTQADIAFRRTLQAIHPTRRSPNLTLKTITLMNGAVLWFKSGDHPDTLYGEDVYAAVIDEASRVKEESWHAVRSTLTATRGPIRIIGNVKGRLNWFYQLARKAEQEADQPGTEMAFHRLIAHDAIDAGVLAAEEIEDARRTLPEAVFRELYLAEASDDEGNPFGYRQIKACIGELSDKRPQVWGWDLGKSNDYTVGIALDRDGKVCRFERFREDWMVITRRILESTGMTKALVDSTGVGDPIVEMLQKTGGSNFEGYHFSPSSKQKLMEGLAVAIQTKAITYPDGEIVFELERFEYEHTRTGTRYTAPEGFHDDCVCSLALAVMCKATASTYDSSMEWVGGPTGEKELEQALIAGIRPPPRINPVPQRRRYVPGQGWTA